MAVSFTSLSKGTSVINSRKALMLFSSTAVMPLKERNTDFMGTKVVDGRLPTSQIAAASAASVLFLTANGRFYKMGLDFLGKKKIRNTFVYKELWTVKFFFECLNGGEGRISIVSILY